MRCELRGADFGGTIIVFAQLYCALQGASPATLVSIAEDADRILEDVKRSVGAYDRLRDLLSPDGNGALTKLGKLRRCLKSFRRGEIVVSFLTEWHSSSMRLIEELKQQYPLTEVAEALHHTWNAQKSLYALLSERYEEYDTDEAYWMEIDTKLNGLKVLYRENSNGFARLCAAAYEAEEQSHSKRCRAKSKLAAARHREDEVIYREICRRHNRKRSYPGKGPSYLKIVQAMMIEGDTYSARMRGKSAVTWANQASAFASKMRGAKKNEGYGNSEHRDTEHFAPVFWYNTYVQAKTDQKIESEV